MPLSPAARAHRRDLEQIARQADLDMAALFSQFETPDDIRDGLLDTLPRMMAVYGSAAATLGADWYDDLREDAGVRGRFQAIPAELPDRGRTDALARWSVGPLYAANPDRTLTLSKLTGGFERIIFNADRDTITRSAIQDPGARGWAREGAGECDLCQLLLGRGAVYTEESSQFETHDRCKCVGVPAFQ